MATFDNLANKAEASAIEGKRIALVVGTNNTRASSYLSDLKYAEDDAQEVYHTLRQPACEFEFVCPVLTGEKAETRDVRRAVIKLAQEKADQNFLLFYFIGHAQPMKTKEGYNDIYLVTHDFNENEAKEDSTSHLSMRWLRNMLYKPDGAGRVLIILDCCYAGNIIHVGSDYSRIDLHTFIKGCIDGAGDVDQNGRLRVLLTSTGYNTPAQERVMTGPLLSVLQGKVAQVIDHKGNINIHSLYTYLQDQMPLAQLPNLSGDFPIPCILAHYPEKSHHFLQLTQQAEENDRWHTISQLMDKMSEISSVITDSDYFKRLAETNTRFHTQQF
ncbi:MAG TPA: hypothetical protein VFV38_36180, partial [Ktedonobacteraceae bacterium]|nr:hypothetical protein [Ktedonobacteraceae bacterium]